MMPEFVTMLWRCVAVAMWIYFTLNFIRYSNDSSTLRYGHACLLASAILGVLVFCLTATAVPVATVSTNPTYNLTLR